MVTRAATSLNRILRVTASLLFEKGEDVQAIANFMQGFVDRRMIQSWYEKYCEINGVPTSINQSGRAKRKIPVAPIDFNSVSLDDLEEKLESNQDLF
jgi:hypothetical protein